METQTVSTTKSDPIIIEQAGMRMTVAHRRSGGGDEGLTFDITTAGPEDGGKRILRFDCFYGTPHYHVGATGEDASHKMKDEGVEDPVRWTLVQLKTPVPRDGQTGRILRNRRADRPAIDRRSTHPIGGGNNRKTSSGVRLQP